ncbi:GNAT family N-acetyltransferase [Sporosarcina highlanderae]|uniref:GNAT family N-acetyltransferase n=1 Tax=Sporosarcina highlanderae TaxID=3035916 RepID=A0ABT8JLH3_9BACL|nr:GNAT family N-acetyltransferase [Sporosarcina highlanderae]MDN4605929.1 GNAT family N-acetyltransferase [Sporosarcina highlanderae]
MNYPDIYYHPKWVELYAGLDCGKPGYYKLENDYGTIIYPYVKRVVPYTIEETKYYDIITPYGFNGPCIMDCSNHTKDLLIKSFEEDFSKYCIENNIVTEYVRFSPWLENHIDFQKYYLLSENKKTIAVNLLVDNILTDEISSKRRNLIRKAIKSNVSIQFDYTGETIENFYCLYQNTIQKNSISEYYQFDIFLLKRNFEKLSGNIFIVNAIYEDEIISSSIFLHNGKNLHYHFSANNYEKTNLNGNSLILYTVAEWGKENNKEFLHLGGASRSTDLMKFKLSFTKSNGFPFYVGKRIRQKDVYKKLVQISGSFNSDYFPEYRGG